MFESVALLAHMAATGGVLPREREQDFALRRHHTADNETWTAGDAATTPGTEEVFSAEHGMTRLVTDAARHVQFFSRLLPPVDHEAEAYFDRVSAELSAREQRRPITRKI